MRAVRHIRAVRAYADRPTEAALRTAIAIDPTDYVALFRLANLYVAEGQCNATRPISRGLRLCSHARG